VIYLKLGFASEPLFGFFEVNDVPDGIEILEM
jgi:hypothetical protein